MGLSVYLRNSHIYTVPTVSVFLLKRMPSVPGVVRELREGVCILYTGPPGRHLDNQGSAPGTALLVLLY